MISSKSSSIAVKVTALVTGLLISLVVARAMVLNSGADQLPRFDPAHSVSKGAK